MGFFDKATSVFNPSKWGGSDDPIAGGALGDFIPGIGDARAQDKANSTNIQLDKINRQWQEKMSNSAYQRAMTDMKKAGLNPMLAYQQGGASVPSTSAASVGASSKTGLSTAALAAFTGIKGVNAQAQNANTAQAQMESNVNLANVQTAKTVADTQLTQAETALKKRELKGRGVIDTLDKTGGSLIQKLIDSVNTNSSKSQMYPDKPLIKSLGPGPAQPKIKKD